MAQYSITIAIAYGQYPWSAGHVALIQTTPEQQIYSGFGPLRDGSELLGGFVAHGKYDVQYVTRPHGPTTTGTDDFSTVFGEGDVVSFTLPGTASQALSFDIWNYTKEQNYLLAQINRTFARDFGYDAGVAADGSTTYVIAADTYYCTTMSSEGYQAFTGSSNVALSGKPSWMANYLTAIADALAVHPDALSTGVPGFAIPEGLRGIQKDYYRATRGWRTSDTFR